MSDTEKKTLFPVTVLEDDGTIVVTDYVINMYGVGDTKQEAIDDYNSVVKEYLTILEADAGRLGSHLKKHLAILRTVTQGRSDDAINSPI